MNKQEIVRRKEAIALGLKFYFTGEPCSNGHLAKRRVRIGQCVECDRRSIHNHYHRKAAEKLQGIAEKLLKRVSEHLGAIQPTNKERGAQQ